MLSFGISSIGKVGPTYSQNVKTLDEYYDRSMPIACRYIRGIELTDDDSAALDHPGLMCHFELSIESIESRAPDRLPASTSPPSSTI
jgi:oxygen-independent coproporphyrinogen-3 oxidase